MEIQRTSYSSSPEKITQAEVDCVWIRLEPRESPRPLMSPALQWLDWKLRGQISRFLVAPVPTKGPTFIPTMRRLPIPFVALDASKETDWPAFFSHCAGLKWKRVLFYAEDQRRLAELERDLKRKGSDLYPEAVFVGTDLPQEDA